MSPIALFRRRGARPARSSLARGVLRVEPLEGREVPATLLGLTSGNTLVTFDSATPNAFLVNPVAVTGLANGETLVGIDYRPANGLLYGVGSTSRLYVIDAATGVAAGVGGVFGTALDGTSFGVDFNPVADRLRVVSNTGQSLRIVPDTGVAAADTGLTFDSNDATNQGYYGTNPGDLINPSPQASAAAYTLNFDATLGTNVTTLYAIDASQDILFRIGGPDGDPSPNGGLSVVADQLRNPNTFALVDFGTDTTFDIQAGTDTAYAVSGSSLYGVNLTTAAATPLGTVAGTSLTGLAIVPPASGAGVLQLSTSTAAFATDRDPIAVTVTRTGGASLEASVAYATADGSAVAGVDYLPNSGTLTFAAGVLTRTIFLLVPAGAPRPGPAKTFTLTLTGAGGGAALGAVTTATVTVPAVVAATPGTTPAAGSTVTTPTRFYAAGSGRGGRVAVYDADSGNQLVNFAAFGGGFGGSAVVAVGDLNSDGFDDLIVGAGAGGGPRVTVYDGRAISGGSLAVMADFFAFGQGFTGGVSVAAGDVDGDGFVDLIVGAGAGGGPRVSAFDGGELARGNRVLIRDFFAFQPSFLGGVNVASGELTGDGFDDIAVGAAAGGGPRLAVFDGLTLDLVASFFAYGQGFTGGVSLAVGDVNGDDRQDLLAGPGAGGGPRLRAFDGRSLGGNPSSVADFFAFEQGFTGGVNVAARDLDGDGFADVIVGPGRTGGPRLRVFGGAAVVGGNPSPLSDLFPFPGLADGGLYVG